MKKNVPVFICTLILFVSGYSFAINGARITKSPPEGKIPVTVLPILNFTDEKHAGITITGAIIDSLSGSDLVSVLPMKVMAESLWKYCPDSFSVKPMSYPADPDSMEFFGGLELEQKQYFSTQLGVQYLIDGTYYKEGESRKLTLNMHSVTDNKTAVALTGLLPAGDTPESLAVKLSAKIEGYFFDIYADSMALDIINKAASGKIRNADASNTLEQWLKKYGDNLFVFAALMILKNDAGEPPAEIIRFGRQWFASQDIDALRQIKFFKSLNVNPYLILGKAYMVRADYAEAQKPLYAGYNTFPFNTEGLVDDLILCLELAGEHEKAELIKQKKKETGN